MAKEANSTLPDSAQPGAAQPGGELDGLGYEQAREELVSTVQRLEAGGLSLEESLALWERGEALHRRCAEILGAAEERLRALRPDGAGT